MIKRDKKRLGIQEFDDAMAIQADKEINDKDMQYAIDKLMEQK